MENHETRLRIRSLISEADRALAMRDWTTANGIGLTILALDPGNFYAERFIARAQAKSTTGLSGLAWFLFTMVLISLGAAAVFGIFLYWFIRPIISYEIIDYTNTWSVC